MVSFWVYDGLCLSQDVQHKQFFFFLKAIGTAGQFCKVFSLESSGKLDILDQFEMKRKRDFLCAASFVNHHFFCRSSFMNLPDS